MSNQNEMIECPISPSTNKLLQAYIAISNEDPEDILQEIGKTIEEALKKHLLKRTLEAMRDNHGDILLEFTRENYGDVIAGEAVQDLLESPNAHSIATLSSDDDETWAEHKPRESKNGITDADLENDMTVDDPEKEAAADALPIDIDSPEAMAKLLNGEVKAKEIPASPPEINPLEARRRKNIKITAKVSMSSSPVDDLGGGVVV